MKRLLSASLLVVLIMAHGVGLVAAEKSRTRRVAVFNFEDKSGHRYRWWTGQPVGEGMADMLVTALVKTGRYQVIERQELNRVMEEQKLGASGLVTQQTAAEIGKLLGVDLGIFGSVTEFGYSEDNLGGSIKKRGFGVGVKTSAANVGIDVRLVNTTTGEILSAESVRKKESKKGLSLSTQDFDFNNKDKFDESLVGKATRDAIDQVVELVGQSMRALPWSATIIKGDGPIYINAGSQSGVEVGEEFVVYRAGEELVDPDTGLSLGKTESKIGVIRVVNNQVSDGRASQCEAVQGAGFLRSDIVREK
ncbi:hypothetical protein JW992_02290 [candidate division KSB1 bacterium]|nr:hypothetical protein [candidate division KSB1 bacterium]